MRLNAKQICEFTKGRMLVEPSDPAELAVGISWDSRDISSGDLYVALTGKQRDGHDFVDEALRSGAHVVLVSASPHESTERLALELGAAIIEVDDTVEAISDIAREWRSMISAQVVAVTGSCGKTTTKNLVRDVLKTSFSVVATQGNQNNELGVPKTILEAGLDTQVVVVEMGMCGLGELQELSKVTQPDIGLITNIGESHIELLGSRDNIARAKAELFSALPEGRGKAFMGRSENYIREVPEWTQLEERQIELTWYDGSMEAALHKAEWEKQRRLGETGGTELWGAWAEDISLDAHGRPKFVLHLGTASRTCLLSLRGAHNVKNAVAAASVGASFGIDIDTILAALESSQPESGRQEHIHTQKGFTVINDTYNANPASMKAALSVLSKYEVPGKRIAVLGDMGELGEFSQSYHEEVGHVAAALSFDRLICVGDLARFIAGAAREAGMDADKVRSFDSIQGALTDLHDSVGSDDVVLVKASRFMELERIVGGLID